MLVLWLFFLAATNAYLFGDYQQAYCWRSATGSASSLREKCDETIKMRWEQQPASKVEAGKDFTARYQLLIDSSYVISRKKYSDVEHANMHACPTSIGQCTPQASGGLISSSAAKSVNFTEENNGYLIATTDDTFELEEGDYTLIAHVWFYFIENGEEIRMDVAIGMDISSEKTYGYLSENIEYFIVALAGLTYLYQIGLLVLMVINWNEDFMRKSIRWLTLFNILGSIIFTTVVFFKNLYMTEITCKLFVSFASLGWTLLFTPLFIKALTFHLFPDHTNGKFDGNTSGKNIVAGVTMAAAIIVDAVLLSVWLTLYPPEAPTADSEFRDSCHFSEESRVLAGLTYALKGTIVAAAVILVWTASSEGYHKNSLARIRGGITIMAIAVAVVLIIETAFKDDVEFVFLIRSLAILVSAIWGTLWLYQEWKERNMLAKIGVNAINDAETSVTSRSCSEYDTQLEAKELSSMKVFNELFSYSVIRGYLLRHCDETLDTESVSFCSDVIKFRQNPNLHLAESIVELYIHADSTKCVNISSGTREATMENFKNFKKYQMGSDWSKRSDSVDIYAHELKEPEKRGQKLSKTFDAAFKEVRRLIYLNNWRDFRVSDYGVAAATWFQWLEYMDDYSLEEKIWVADDISRKLKKEKRAMRRKDNREVANGKALEIVADHPSDMRHPSSSVPSDRMFSTASCLNKNKKIIKRNTNQTFQRILALGLEENKVEEHKKIERGEDAV